MENPKERIEDILKEILILTQKNLFASRGENDWQVIKRLCYFYTDITRCRQLFLWMNMTHHCSKRIRRGIGMR